MTLGDWLGTIGVSLLLLAFALNVTKKISVNSTTYLILNIVGSGLACICSCLIPFWPFIILELVWCVASVAALVQLKMKL
jgi:hypothetical protein